MPLSELSGYQSRLNAMTSGQGRYTLELSHYEAVPPAVQQTLFIPIPYGCGDGSRDYRARGEETRRGRTGTNTDELDSMSDEDAQRTLAEANRPLGIGDERE